MRELGPRRSPPSCCGGCIACRRARRRWRARSRCSARARTRTSPRARRSRRAGRGRGDRGPLRRRGPDPRRDRSASCTRSSSPRSTTTSPSATAARVTAAPPACCRRAGRDAGGDASPALAARPGGARGVVDAARRRGRGALARRPARPAPRTCGGRWRSRRRRPSGARSTGASAWARAGRRRRGGRARARSPAGDPRAAATRSSRSTRASATWSPGGWMRQSRRSTDGVREIGDSDRELRWRLEAQLINVAAMDTAHAEGRGNTSKRSRVTSAATRRGNV